MKNAEKIVTRIAPSPTGNLHVGTARSALFNYIFAKKFGGTFVVRIEDTDKERSEAKFEKDILDGLSWLGLQYDELYKQSERGSVYEGYIQKLIETDKAYISKEPSKQNESETVEVVRLRNAGKKITFADLVRGEVTFDTEELGDFVIARSVSDPLYHLAVVIDDEEMGITHVIRGEDHISNTPRQILIQEALGFERPIYAHIPLLLASDRSKLSKRKGETSISKYAEEFLPQAMVNYLALLGWNPGTEQEVFGMDDLIEAFSIEKVQKGGAIFDVEKLKSINNEHIKLLPNDLFEGELRDRVLPKIKDLPLFQDEKLSKIVPELKERVRTFSEIDEMIESGELQFYFDKPSYDISLATWKDETAAEAKEHLEAVKTFIEPMRSQDLSKDSLKDNVWEYATEKGRGSVLWPFRYALTGKEKSPDPFSVAAILGKEEVVARLDALIDAL